MSPEVLRPTVALWKPAHSLKWLAVFSKDYLEGADFSDDDDSTQRRSYVYEIYRSCLIHSFWKKIKIFAITQRTDTFEE